MRNIYKFAPPDNNSPTNARVSVRLPSLAAARDAARYVDRTSYKVAVEGDRSQGRLVAVVRVPNGAASDEFAAFEPVARKFGGTVEYVGAEGPSNGPDFR
jgi:hypothetical protein